MDYPLSLATLPTQISEAVQSIKDGLPMAQAEANDGHFTLRDTFAWEELGHRFTCTIEAGPMPDRTGMADLRLKVTSDDNEQNELIFSMAFGNVRAMLIGEFPRKYGTTRYGTFPGDPWVHVELPY